MPVTKFWTVRDGQVGTVHTSRDGREVDFRPVRRVWCDQDRANFCDPVVRRAGPPAGATIKAEASDGQTPNGEWPLEFFEFEIVPSEGGETEKRIYRFSVNGVPVSTVTERFFPAVDQRRVSEVAAREEAAKAARAAWIQARLADPLEGLTGRLVGQCRRPSPRRREAAAEAVVKAWCAQFPCEGQLDQFIGLAAVIEGEGLARRVAVTGHDRIIAAVLAADGARRVARRFERVGG